MGISPIEYRPWKGKRTSKLNRVIEIIKQVVNSKIKSAGVLILLIVGILLVHTFPIILQSLQPHERLTANMLIGQGLFGQYLKGAPFAIFSILLASVVSADIIAEDLKNNSFILYFSRPIRPSDYILGKIGAGFTIMSLFCLLPPVIFGVAVILTQTGTDYNTSLEVLGRTVIAGSFTCALYLFYGVMLSSFTKRRAYAGVGTFMSFFVLTLLAELFSGFDSNWLLISPINILHYTYNIIYGFDFPQNLNYNLYLLILFSLILIPLGVVYYRIYRRWSGI
ncbi:MAG: ABC transporter permease [Thermoplasmatota archaeon]